MHWADLSDYSPDSSLISEVGWWPDSSSAYCYVQDRAQTWLDLVKVSTDSGAVKRLFRDVTKAWIDSPGPIHAYKDNTFLWVSERDGWKHIYQYADDGKLKVQLTKGDWEVRRLEHVDLDSGWIYFSANKEAPMSSDFYRVKPGGPVERLTQSPGTHTASMSPDGKLFLSSRSDIRTPDRIGLYTADGKLVRTIDSNPSHELNRLKFGPHERIQIPAPRWLPARGRADPADRTRAGQEIPGLVHDVCRTAYAHDLGCLARRPDEGPRDGPRGVHHLPHGPEERQRQGRDVGLEGVQATGRPGARRHQGRDQLAQAKAVCQRVADRYERTQLRRLYHVVRHDPQRPVRRRDRRRARDRLARL